VAYLGLSKQDPFMGINAGFVALCVNFVVTLLVSLMTPAEANRFEQDLVSTDEVKGSVQP
jgi:hypothetical protein